jgi:hypothetical protein
MQQFRFESFFLKRFSLWACEAVTSCRRIRLALFPVSLDNGKGFSTAFIFLLVPFVFGVLSASAQVCSFSVSMVNHNRYAYDTAEECSFPHSVPFGNWGVSSNVGTKQDADQFRGWNNPCSELKVEWNSCSVDYVKPDLDCRRLNFPDPAGLFPYPANGYPFSDRFFYNDSVPPYGSSTCVDQYSPCGPSVYGGGGVTVGVSPQVDYDGDGIADAGGCKDLDGYWVLVQQNFMTLYELDPRDRDDLIESLYFPDVWAPLTCTPDACFAVSDSNFDGWIDDIGNQFSSEYMWPTLYQDNHDVICYPSDPGVPCKRIDATVRIGRVSAYYSGPTPWSCDPYAEQDCYNRGGIWNSSSCTCNCYDFMCNYY